MALALCYVIGAIPSVFLEGLHGLSHSLSEAASSHHHHHDHATGAEHSHDHNTLSKLSEVLETPNTSSPEEPKPLPFSFDKHFSPNGTYVTYPTTLLPVTFFSPRKKYLQIQPKVPLPPPRYRFHSWLFHSEGLLRKLFILTYIQWNQYYMERYCYAPGFLWPKISMGGCSLPKIRL